MSRMSTVGITGRARVLHFESAGQIRNPFLLCRRVGEEAVPEGASAVGVSFPQRRVFQGHRDALLTLIVMNLLIFLINQ